MGRILLSRRRFLQTTAISFGSLIGAGCDQMVQTPSFKPKVNAEPLTLHGQRLLLRGQSLAREFSLADVAPQFPSTGTTVPQDSEYQRLLEQQFAAWRLQVDGRVERPTSFSLSELQCLPSRTQITRHDCVEGWSAIARWQGVPLSLLLHYAQLKADARYVVFHCADTVGGGSQMGGGGGGRYYESIDLIDAFHQQTILAYSLNGKPLPVENGAPLRLRLERQLGYKHAKYVMRVEVAARLDLIGAGKGGYWEDRGYEWYAGI